MKNKIFNRFIKVKDNHRHKVNVDKIGNQIHITLTNIYNTEYNEKDYMKLLKEFFYLNEYIITELMDFMNDKYTDNIFIKIENNNTNNEIGTYWITDIEKRFNKLNELVNFIYKDTLFKSKYTLIVITKENYSDIIDILRR